MWTCYLIIKKRDLGLWLSKPLDFEEEFRELVCSYELISICENTLGEELWSWWLSYILMTIDWCLIGEIWGLGLKLIKGNTWEFGGT